MEMRSTATTVQTTIEASILSSTRGDLIHGCCFSRIDSSISRRHVQAEVALVGGGNSAGQAAVFLSEYASKVHMLVRGPGLATTMSRYLIDRIDATPNSTRPGVFMLII